MIDVTDITNPIATVHATYLTTPSAGDLFQPASDTAQPPAETTQPPAAMVQPPADAPDNRAERCRKYLETLQASISGQNGHDRLLQAACECLRFGLDDATAMDLLRAYNKRAVPPWDERDIERKLSEAHKKVIGDEFGSRLRKQPTGGLSDAVTQAATAPPLVAVDIWGFNGELSQAARSAD